MTVGEDRLLEEISMVAYHFHWSLAEILDLEHALRGRFIDQIAQLHRADG